MKIKKILKAVLIISVLLVAYINIGHIYAYYLIKADYYPTSLAAKILTPWSPFQKNLTGPFSLNTPSVNPRLEKECGNFDKYLEKTSTFRFSYMLLWPAFALVIYLVCALSWIVWLICVFFGSAWEGLKFLCDGNLLKIIGIT